MSVYGVWNNFIPEKLIGEPEMLVGEISWGGGGAADRQRKTSGIYGPEMLVGEISFVLGVPGRQIEIENV